MDLPKQYSGVRLIDNPYFDSCNNISSLYVARHLLDNCIILDGDQIINNPDVLQPKFDKSGYNAIWCDGGTEEWLMKTQNGIVKSCSRTGGRHGWQLFSISRWDTDDGAKLRKFLEYEFEKGNTQVYWDDVPMFLHFAEFELGVFEMNAGDVLEIDNLRELAAIDKKYIKYIK